MNLIDAYQAAITRGTLLNNTNQQLVLHQLAQIANQLTTPAKRRWWQRWKQPQAIRGLYLWGKVGCGKTMLMDLFYHSLSISKKKRLHFHAFMREVHRELHKLRGRSDPLKIIANKLADSACVLCFDEFVVEEIGDAMILAELLKTLFARGVVLIATSNTAPDLLYNHSLQRQRFLPAIKLIKQHCDVIELETGIDYRLQHMQSVGRYFTPLNTQAHHNLEEYFAYYADREKINDEPLQILGRSIPVVKSSLDVIWCECKIICGDLRSQLDYLELCQNYRVFLISNVPQFKPTDDDIANRFIKLIDVLYDQHADVIISAAVPIDKLYPVGRFAETFKRTASRLKELQAKKT